MLGALMGRVQAANATYPVTIPLKTIVIPPPSLAANYTNYTAGGAGRKLLLFTSPISDITSSFCESTATP
jgi:hypothetical protein